MFRGSNYPSGTAAHYAIKCSTCGLVAMTSAPHAEGRQLEPGQVYLFRRMCQLLPSLRERVAHKPHSRLGLHN